LSGVGDVTRVYTCLAVIDIAGGHFDLRKKPAQVSFGDLQSLIGARPHLDGPAQDLNLPEL
jgi:3-oxoadipate CoA-transferase beta subunit